MRFKWYPTAILHLVCLGSGFYNEWPNCFYFAYQSLECWSIGGCPITPPVVSEFWGEGKNGKSGARGWMPELHGLTNVVEKLRMRTLELRSGMNRNPNPQMYYRLWLRDRKHTVGIFSDPWVMCFCWVDIDFSNLSNYLFIYLLWSCNLDWRNRYV